MSIPVQKYSKQDDIKQVITENIDIWTSAIEQKSSAGRGSSKKISLHGIKKLRELILELAVRGKLVPQDANDEPASVLLERIAAEKAQLVKDKNFTNKRQKPKVLPEIREDEKPFELPKGWEWSRFDYLPLGYSVGLDRGKSQQGPDNKFRYFKMNNISNEGGFDLKSVVFVDASDEEVKQYTLKDHDLLFNTRNSKELVGKTCVYVSDAPEPILYNNNILRAFFSDNKLSYILDIWMRSPSGKLELEKIKSGTTNVWAIYQGKLALLHCIIPPLKEQHRIVAKVDELMSLCDALEVQTENSIDAHQTLVEVLLTALLRAPEQGATPEQSVEQFQQNWQRLSEHFDTLFTTTASIDSLKQTILQLAVMGKLVPQNPNDEPAGKLLERIAAEKAQLIKDKKIKKQKPLPEITEDEKPFELPNGWEWCRFEDIVDINGGITKGRKLAGRELITVPYLSVANVQRSYLNLEHLKEIDIPVEEKEKYSVKKRDLLITEGGDWDKVGRTAIWSDELDYVGHQNHVFKARIFLEEQCEVWLEKYLNGPYARDYFAGSSKQTTNLASINKTQLRGCLIALPPKGELGDIIVKVNELMTLCDQLKARLTDAQTTKLHLTDAIVEQAL